MLRFIAWAVVCLVFLGLELMASGDVVSIWFAFGAMITCIVSAFGITTLPVEMLIFAIISAVTLIAFRPVVMKYFKFVPVKTNLDAIKEQTVIIIEPVTENKPGTAKLEGVIWSVVSKNEQNIESGTKCRVVEIAGNKLIVEQIKN